MKYFVSGDEMKRYDANTIQHFGMPSVVLMERAATAFVEELHAQGVDGSRVLVACGSGNNGGDGYAIARLLLLEGCSVTVLAAGEQRESRATEENRLQRRIYEAYGGRILNRLPEREEQPYTAVIDAVFGVGLSREITGIYAEQIGRLNALSGTKVAVDVPSGISDSGAILGAAFRADLTVTFAFQKLGCVLWPGNTYSGRVVVREIGITEHSFLGELPKAASLEPADLAQLPEHVSHSNKGSYGRLLLAAGSAGMAGAAYLGAKAAYCSGCGLVRIATPEENRVILQTSIPEAVLTTYPAGSPLTDEAFGALEWADAIVCGPGLGTSPAAMQLLRAVLEYASAHDVPLLLDADALNLIAQDIRLLSAPHGTMIVTPHLGEMSRLTGESVALIQSRLIAAAQEFAQKYQVVCVLKDEHTVTATPEGQIWVNCSGNAGMATAGSGDVLSGLVGSLMAQGLPAEAAAPLGVYLHGLAGDVMAEETGICGLMAGDLPEGIRRVLAGIRLHGTTHDGRQASCGGAGQASCGGIRRTSCGGARRASCGGVRQHVCDMYRAGGDRV